MTMNHATLRIRARGPLLVGGHTAPPVGTDARTATDPHGRPVIPASVLRGAIRESVYRLARSEDLPACVAWERCADAECWTCRIFGRRDALARQFASSGSPSEGRGWARPPFRVGDATLTNPHDPSAVRPRHGVGIDRWTGRAASQRLYRRDVAEHGEATRYEAKVEIELGDAERALLVRALALVESLGNSQSRGHGGVRLELVEAGDAPPSAFELVGRVGPSVPMRMTLTAREPLHIGGVPDRTSLRRTLRFVPATALQGALHAAARRAGLPAEQCVALATGVQVDDLLPAGEAKVLPVPFPRCFQRCTDCGKLVDLSVREAATRAAAARGALLEEPRCPTCSDGGRLKPGTGVLPEGHVPVRVVTRLARDPLTGSGALGLLHAREQIAADTAFVGTVVFDEAGWKALDALRTAGEPLRVGGFRARGLGDVGVALEPADDTLRHRVETWRRRAVSGLEGALGWLGWDPSGLLLAVARTPVAPEGDAARDAQALVSALVSGAQLHAAWQRNERRPLGWEDRQVGAEGPGFRPTIDAIRPGSAWLFSAPATDLRRLRELEVHGFGLHTEFGLGRFVFCPLVSELG